MPPINNALALQYAAASVHGSEGFRPAAYRDTLARPPVWTIGYGTTRIGGIPVHAGDRCTQAEAAAWSAADMQTTLVYVLTHVTVPLDDWQAAACVALSYNIGMGNFRNSSVIAALNQGDYRAAADCFLEYDHAGGVQVAGLTARRIRERAMFLCMMPPDPTVIVTAKAAPASEADALNRAQLDKA